MAAEPPRKEGKDPLFWEGRPTAAYDPTAHRIRSKSRGAPLGPGKLAPSLRNAHNGPTIDEL